MASSSKPERIYHVFLSFRGEDVRNNFIGHLYRALDQIGIYTYIDSEELKKGEQIAPALMKAIEESQIAIIVFSEDYASSWWCLEEVAKIMDSKKGRDLMVFPLFYKVEPREVRTPREKYREAMVKHESKFGKDSKEVKRWEKALFDAGSLSGWCLRDGDESELIQKIMKEISTYLAGAPLHVAKHPVGIYSQVVKLKSMLNLESDDALMMGIWGPGGIGKTTLAKAIYNGIYRQFEGSCFLANVREFSKSCTGLETLQGKLLNDILLPQQKLEVSNVDAGINLIQDRLRCKKILIILDDVDDLRQLQALAGEGNWFGNGSRVIITTRDKHVLTCLEIHREHVYEVETLDDGEACELLSKHAFLTHQKFKIGTDLVDGVLNHAKGLPLALVVLGSFLCGRREYAWKSTLNKLSRIPDKTINDVLKISYDGLDKNEREIFLHIACFFKGWDSAYVEKMLESCNFEATIGLDVLTERSLISIEFGFLQVHDLIQSMGMDVVNQQYPDDPKRRSRLWLFDDVLDVLSCDKGDCAVEAIVLDLPELKEICIGPDTFTKMRKLRLLIVRNVHTSFQGPIYFPNDLRWLQWSGCAPWIPEFSFSPKKLVGLDMHGSSIRVVPKQFKDFQNLKYLNFSGCKSLIRIPDVSCTPNLEELELQHCTNLVEVHVSIAYHDKLQVLNLEGCSELRVFPYVLKSKNLQILNLQYCGKFQRFPDIPHKLEGLKQLFLQGTAIKGLPVSIENLISLEAMHLSNCRHLVSLLSSIYKLQSIIYLQLWNCRNLIGFPKYEDSTYPRMETGLPNLRTLCLGKCNLSDVEFLEDLSCFPFLSDLDLSGNNITSLPKSISKRDRLSALDVEDCHQLQEIPKLPPFLNYFWVNNCESLQKNGDLTSFHDFVRRGLTTAETSSLDEFRLNDSTLSEIRPEFTTTLPGEEMPEWVFPVEGSSVHFMASRNLYEKFLGLVLCVVLGSEKSRNRTTLQLVPHVNGERRDFDTHGIDLDSDHIWLQYFTASKLWGAVDFGQIDGSYMQFGLTLESSNAKKWGVRIISKQIEDDLKVVLQDNRLINLALLYEVYHESIYSEAESSLMHEDSLSRVDPQENLQDCQMSTEEHSRVVSERNHELFSVEACEPRACELLIRLAEMSMAVVARCFCSWNDRETP